MRGWAQLASVSIEDTEIRGLIEILELTCGGAAPSAKTRTQDALLPRLCFASEDPRVLLNPSCASVAYPQGTPEKRQHLAPVTDGKRGSPQIHVSKPNPQRDGMRRWVSWEVIRS